MPLINSIGEVHDFSDLSRGKLAPVERYAPIAREFKVNDPTKTIFIDTGPYFLFPLDEFSGPVFNSGMSDNRPCGRFFAKCEFCRIK